jgi:hypothetical protein
MSDLDAAAPAEHLTTFGSDSIGALIRSFVAATVGLGPVFESSNPLQLSSDIRAAYVGVGGAALVIDLGQLRHWILSKTLEPTGTVISLTQMLVIAASAEIDQARNRTPPFELLRHLRNASAHGNRFKFHSREPKLPAVWRHLTLDHERRGARNPLAGSQCIGAFAMPADVIQLLAELRKSLRDDPFTALRRSN